MEHRPPGMPSVLPLSPLPLGARPGQSQAPTCPDQRIGKLSRRLSFPCPSSRGTPSLCIPSVPVPFLQKHLIFQILFVHFVSLSSMKTLLLLKSLKREFSKKNFFSFRRFHFSPKFHKSEKPHPMGATRPWVRVGPGGLLGGPPPKRAHLATTRALCYKIPKPSKPFPVREAGKRGGSVR